MLRPMRTEPSAGQESVWDYPRPPRLEKVGARLRVIFCGRTIADTTSGHRVLETSHPPVYYLPMEDVEMSFLSKTDHHTYCPYKGQASYWSIYMDGRIEENKVWAYEDPYPTVAALRGRVAFYPVVEVYEVDEADLARVVPSLGDDAGNSTP